MTETAAAPAEVVPSTSLKKATKKTAVKKPANKSTHPSTAEMVNAAIETLKEKKGSSLVAIKKYIAATYKVDVSKQAQFIRKYLKAAVEKKTIIQTKGVGASGRFKLADKPKAEKKKVVVAEKSAAKKLVGEKKVAAKKPAAKKSAGEKVATKKPIAKKPADKKPTATKSAKPKVAKPTNAKTTKTAPKPKKVAAPKAKPAKK